jgi:hypothetical protein
MYRDKTFKIKVKLFLCLSNTSLKTEELVDVRQEMILRHPSRGKKSRCRIGDIMDHRIGLDVGEAFSGVRFSRFTDGSTRFKADIPQ